MSNGIKKHQLFCKDFNKITSEYRTTIMGIAMLSVMLFHQYFTSIVPFNAFHNFGNWGVDVIIFLSGMGLVRSLEKYSLLIYYKRRLKRIIPSCILCGTSKYIVFILLGSSVAVLKFLAKFGVRFHGHTAYSFLTLAYGVPALIIANIYFLKILPDILKQFVIFTGKYSLELYLVHEFIFWCLKIIFINGNPWLLLATGFLLSYMAAYLCKFLTNIILP